MNYWLEHTDCYFELCNKTCIHTGAGFVCLSLALASRGFIDGKSLGPFTPAPAGCFVTGASTACESG